MKIQQVVERLGKEELQYACSVAKVDEYQCAEIAPCLHPSHYRDIE